MTDVNNNDELLSPLFLNVNLVIEWKIFTRKAVFSLEITHIARVLPSKCTPLSLPKNYNHKKFIANKLRT